METIKLPLFFAVLALFVTFATAGTPKATTIGVAQTVDAGKSFTLTCTRDSTDTVTAANMAFKFYKDGGTTEETVVAGAVLTTTTAASAKYKCRGLDTTATPNTPGGLSPDVAITVTAIVAPTMTCVPAATGTPPCVAVDIGKTVVCTCTKAAANNAPASFKFFEGTTEVTSGVSGATLTITAAAANDGKVYKCQFFNTATAKMDSITITTGSCPVATTKSSAVTHVVSLTTMVLFLVLGAIMRE